MSKNLPVIIIGAGGHGKVVAEALLAAGHDVIGFTDKTRSKDEIVYAGIKVLGDDRKIEYWAPKEVLLANGVGSLPGQTLRANIFDDWKQKGYFFTSVIHPSAVVASDSLLEEGVQLMAGAILQPGTRIGRNTIINTAASVDHDCNVGAHAHISPGAVLCGGVTVGDFCHIGASATVIQSRKVADATVVGAGAVVISDLLQGGTVTGVPARPRKEGPENS